jgi:hypothetical protein
MPKTKLTEDTLNVIALVSPELEYEMLPRLRPEPAMEEKIEDPRCDRVSG